MLDLAFLAFVTVWAAGTGLWVARRFGALPEHPADALGLAVPLGLGLLGLGVLGLGEVGALGVLGIRALLWFGAVPCFAGWVTLLQRDRQPDTGGVHDRPALPDRLLAAFAAATLAGTLLTALAPVTDGDALCYHLQVPKRFLEAGSVGFDPDLHETVYPLLTEMLYAVGLALRGPVACRLLQWSLGLVFALNVTALARPVLGRRAWWAGVITLLVPAVSNGMSAPLNDVALAAFGAAALHAWSRFHDRPSFRGAALTGILTGLAMGVKYPALVLAGLIGLAVGPGLAVRSFFQGFGLRGLARRRAAAAFETVVEQWSGEVGEERPRVSRRFFHASVFALAAWGVGGCWYARAYWHTGNPVHPFFRDTFGGSGLDEVLGAEKRPLPVTPWNLVTALGPLTLEPDTFDSFSHQFGPMFLLFLPALLLERPPRRVLLLGGIGYAFLAICLTQRQSTRFVLTALGPLSVGVAWLANAWWTRCSVPGRFLVGALLLAAGMESCLAVGRARHGSGVVLGRETADDYLARREPSFSVGRWVGENLPGDARLVGQDHRGFYIPRPYAMELAHRRRTGLGRHGETSDEVIARLRRDGFTHLLLCPPVPESAVEFDPTLGRLLSPWLAGQTPLYREDLADADGVVRRYALYDLAGASRLAAVNSPGGSRR